MGPPLPAIPPSIQVSSKSTEGLYKSTKGLYKSTEGLSRRILLPAFPFYFQDPYCKSIDYVWGVNECAVSYVTKEEFPESFAQDSGSDYYELDCAVGRWKEEFLVLVFTLTAEPWVSQSSICLSNLLSILIVISLSG